MLFLIIGPPGCGKGTLSKKLSEDPKFIHISTGDILRKESKENQDLKSKLSQGEYISDEFTTNLLLKEIKKDKICILDGYPRNLNQIKILEEVIGEPSLVIHLNLKESESKERILGRKDNREDDKEGILNKRFELYYELTKPVVDYYKKKGKVIEIDASKGKEEVYEEVKGKM
ncbi:Adenylate kinase [Nosema bombycis CQ1]|uniref:Adenylate kinase n=1 Tax=Nosema bombycis (strain CQ1 / CVCC 102059) TaxID=578461 RepID=R0KVC5_NOSB1|nr:Adenylate kinase [Nosema bombycis CQ1]|eukprot:EOB14821.1 Adenylate kinase [Nosema bombycis CQ1]